MFVYIYIYIYIYICILIYSYILIYINKTTYQNSHASKATNSSASAVALIMKVISCGIAGSKSAIATSSNATSA